jgi:hypothetical protein
MTLNNFTTHQQNISELCNKAEELLLVKDDSDNTSPHIICLIGHNMKLVELFYFSVDNCISGSSYCKQNCRKKGGCAYFKRPK